MFLMARCLGPVSQLLGAPRPRTWRSSDDLGDGVTPGMALRESHLQGPRAGHLASLPIDSSLQITGDKKAALRLHQGLGGASCRRWPSARCVQGVIVTDTLGTWCLPGPGPSGRPCNRLGETPAWREGGEPRASGLTHTFLHVGSGYIRMSQRPRERPFFFQVMHPEIKAPRRWDSSPCVLSLG